jgi:uncharacterized protein YbbC (DUF1343 family)
MQSCVIAQPSDSVEAGAGQTDKYFHILKGLNVGVVANHTTLVGGIHLIDTLVSSEIMVRRIFSPEHGFRGTLDAGFHFEDGLDTITGIRTTSLYGRNRKPRPDQMKGIDIIIFDIQDVGARFYTYISTLQYVMEACAEANIPLLVLDRPNPNGHFVDGPVLDTAYRSFVGMQPIPVVHGMTIGEYALMLNGEGWLKDGVKCDLQVIKCRNYDHNTEYILPIQPSPNLPNQVSVWLYPSLCLFEGTSFSCGRGTDIPFQTFGHPDFTIRNFSFIPLPKPGATDPKFNGQECFGIDLSQADREGLVPMKRINLSWLIDAYRTFPDKGNFFNSYFTTLAGTDKLKQQIIDGLSENEIRLSWQEDLARFKEIRSRYLLYK